MSQPIRTPAYGLIIVLTVGFSNRKFLSFMRSYPNLIPLSAKQVTGIAVALEPFQFDTIYGHYFDRVITSGGKRILEISVKRYVDAISGAYEHEGSNTMIAAARPRWSRHRRGPSANAREAVNGDKKESQRQDQGKAQEDLAHRGDYPQKNQEGQKKTGEEGSSPARITKKSQAGRERRDQTDAG